MVRQIIVSGERPWIDITEAFYPTIFRALSWLSEDAGYGQDHETYAVSDRWREALPMIEQALADLPEKEHRSFVFGDAQEQNRVAQRSIPLTFAHNLLNDFAEN